MRVLVIDDDRSVGSAIESLLSRRGHEVVVVENGRVGTNAFETSNFELVMVDIFMPEMDGLETIQHFRHRNPKVPIIAMSGFRFCEARSAAPNFLRMATELGATYGLPKPFDLQQLMASVNACLDCADRRELEG